jgi:4-amino-4-deoxy-L-arabinose transferase-like glycosyltransferase
MAKTAQEKNSPFERSTVAVMGAVLVAAALRFFDLGGVPPALNQDEAMNGYDAYSIFVTGRDHLGHAFPIAGLESFGDWVSPLLTFLSVPFVGALGVNLVSIRAVTAAVGVLAVPLAYRLGVEFLGSRAVGVGAAWLLALSPWHVHLSRFAIPPALVPTLCALLLVALAWAGRTSGKRAVVITSLVAALTVVSYPTMKLYVPLLLLTAIIIYWPAYQKAGWEALAYATVVFLAVAGPNLYVSVFDPGGRGRLENVSIFRHAEVTPSVLISQYFSYLDPSFLFLSGDGNPVHSPPGYGLEPVVALPLVAVGLAGVLVKLVRGSLPRRPLILVMTALVLYPVPGSLTHPAPHTLRAAHVLPILALLGATGAVVAINAVQAIFRSFRFGTRTVRAVTVVCAALLAAVYVPFLVEMQVNYFDQYPKEVTKKWNYGLKEAIGYARQHEDEYDVIYVDQPYIYVLFYNRWPPSDVHEMLAWRRDPPGGNRVEGIGRYRFQLPPDFRPERLDLLGVIYDKGQPVYEVRRGVTIENSQRVLVVRRL